MKYRNVRSIVSYENVAVTTTHIALYSSQVCDVSKSLTKDLSEETRQESQNWIPSQAVELYISLYRVEKIIKDMTPEREIRPGQRLAVPLWEEVNRRYAAYPTPYH